MNNVYNFILSCSPDEGNAPYFDNFGSLTTKIGWNGVA